MCVIVDCVYGIICVDHGPSRGIQTAILPYSMLLRLVPTVVALIGLWIFSTGFLIVRKSLDTKSDCNSAPYPDPSNPECWVQSPFTKPPKIVLLVIDALRIDMVVPPAKDDLNPPVYRNKLTVLWEMAQTHVKHARLFRFIADPPTATTQRLQGLLAGTLPTFVEIGGTFSESALQMDSWLWQALNSNSSPYKRIHFYGDDTWTNLCPFMKRQSSGVVEGYLSFHLFDLHTVDTAIKQSLFPLLQSRNFDLLIAHFLGHDHCGHKHGPLHEECGAKLAEIDNVIRRTIDGLEKEDILIVLGDHGMTDEGDHGGVSPKEVSSVLFAYSAGHLLPDAIKEVQHMRDQQLSADDLNYFTTFNNSYIPSLNQIDLVPTLSYLMGLPIPFGNLGMIAPDLLFNADASFALRAIQQNAHQLKRYLQRMNMMDESLQAQLDYIDNSNSRNYVHYAEWMSVVLTRCKQQWATFDNRKMTTGIVVCFTMIVNYLFDLGHHLTTIVILVHSVLMTTTSFVVFEDDLVRFILSTVLVLAPIDKNTFTALLIVRLLKYVSGCREEQHPHCQTISHRNISIIGYLLIFTVLTGVSYSRYKRVKWQYYLVLCWWLGWWLTESVVVVPSGPLSTIADIVSVWTPRLVWLMTIIMKPTRESIVLSLAVLQRPLNGLVLITALPWFQQAITEHPHRALLQCLFGQALFYATGHQSTLSSLQWETSFIAYKTVFPPLQAVLMILNTISGPLVSSLYWSADSGYNTAIAYYLSIAVASALACQQLIRHLMIWKIFAPRFLFAVLIALSQPLVLLLFRKHK